MLSSWVHLPKFCLGIAQKTRTKLGVHNGIERLCVGMTVKNKGRARSAETSPAWDAASMHHEDTSLPSLKNEVGQTPDDWGA